MSRHLAKNTAYFTLASVGQKAIAFVYFLFLARVMQPEATGAYFLAVSMSTIFSVVADVGLTPVLIREIARVPEKAKSLLREVLALKAGFAVLAVFGAVLVSWLLGYDLALQQLIWLALLVLVVDTVQVTFYGVLRGFQRLQFESVGVFAGMLTTATLGGLVLWQMPSLSLLLLALLAGSFVNLAVSGSRVVAELGWGSLVPSIARARAKQLLWIAFPFALAGVFVKIYSYVDSIFISKFLGTAAVGVYAIAYKFTYAFQFLPLAFIAALYPGLSALVGKDEAGLERMFTHALSYMALLVAPLVFGIYAVAPELVQLAGEGYESSAPVLRLLVLVLIPIFLDFPIGSLLNAADRQRTKTAILGVTMVINVALNWVLIPQIGIEGAAWAALASFSAMLIMGLWFVRSIIPAWRVTRLGRICFWPFLSAGIMLVVVMWLKPMIGWLPVIAVGAGVYVALTWVPIRRLLRSVYEA